METAMLRNVLIAFASIAFAGTAFADCDASHAAKREITDDQAKATQPAVKTAAAAPVAKKKQVASDKSKQPARNSVALAPESMPQGEKPTN
jgi:hypothetical protein